MESVVRLENVWKTYRMGEEVINALQGVNLEIKKGEFFAIQGSSGSGKSTAMHIIGALDTPDKGSGKTIHKFYKPQTAVMTAMRKEILLVFAVLSVLALLALAAAATADSENKDKGNDAENLQSYSDRALCNIDFHSKVLSDTAAKVPQASALKSWADKLASDASQLKSMAAANDSAAFHKFVRETLNDDLKAADAAVRNERKNYRAYNVTKNVTEELKEDYKAGKKAFSQCERQNNIKIAQQRVNVYSHFLSQRQEEIVKLEKRNISTAELSAIITEAQDTIVKPIQDAISSGDINRVAAALKQYCLENGCRNGTNFHFSAKFEQARLAALLSVVKPDANTLSLTAELANVQGNLAESKAALKSVGTADYKSSQRNQVWKPLKSTVEALEKLRQNLNAVKKAEMEKKKEERKAEQEKMKQERQEKAAQKANDTK